MNHFGANKYQIASLLRFAKQGRVGVLFKGDIDDTRIENVIDKAIDYINSDKLKTAFENPDFIPSTEEKSRIRLKYNQAKQIWEPENFGDYRRELEEMKRWAQDNISS